MTLKKENFVADCIPGTYRSAGGCQNCPVGTYQDLNFQEFCKACPSDRNTTETTRATSISFCISKWVVLLKIPSLKHFALAHSYLKDEWMFLRYLQTLWDDYVFCFSKGRNFLSMQGILLYVTAECKASLRSLFCVN